MVAEFFREPSSPERDDTEETDPELLWCPILIVSVNFTAEEGLGMDDAVSGSAGGFTLAATSDSSSVESAYANPLYSDPELSRRATTPPRLEEVDDLLAERVWLVVDRGDSTSRRAARAREGMAVEGELS